MPAGAHGEPVGAVMHIEVGDPGTEGEQQQGSGGKAPRWREREETEPRRRGLGRAAYYAKPEVGIRRRPQRNLLTRRAQRRELFATIRAGHEVALEGSLRDRIDLVIQEPDEQFLAIAHMHI